MPVHLFPLRVPIQVGGVGAASGVARAACLGHKPGLTGRIPPPVTRLTITGITKDETGAAMGGFTVYLFNMSTGVPVLTDQTVSDGAGNYAFSVGLGMRYWVVDYKAGAPDKTGASVNTLVGA